MQHTPRRIKHEAPEATVEKPLPEAECGMAASCGSKRPSSISCRGHVVDCDQRNLGCCKLCADGLNMVTGLLPILLPTSVMTAEIKPQTTFDDGFLKIQPEGQAPDTVNRLL